MDSILRAQGAKENDHFLVFVISKGRPDNVPSINALFVGTNVLPHWIVGVGESDAYKSKGAFETIEGGGLCASRNAAIEHALREGKHCVQMSDDISELKILYQGGKWEKPADLIAGNALAKEIGRHIVSPVIAARAIELEMRATGAKLGGVYPTANEGQAMLCTPASSDLFVIGDFVVIDAASSPRFDERMTLKEGSRYVVVMGVLVLHNSLSFSLVLIIGCQDYDFTASHLFTYGVVARSNRVIVKATHYTNAGGAVAHRSDDREQYNIAILRHKWPGVFPQHGTACSNVGHFLLIDACF
jgi:hypothetical protein